MYDRALKHGMVEEGADPVYCIVSIQQLLDEAQEDQVTIEELIIGRDSIFGLSRRYLYLLEKETLLRFPAAQVSLKSYETSDPEEDSLEIVLGEDSRFLALPAIPYHQWPEVFETPDQISSGSANREEKIAATAADHADLHTIPVQPDTVPVQETSARPITEQITQTASVQPRSEDLLRNRQSQDIVQPAAARPAKKKGITPVLISVLLVLVLAGGGLFFFFSSGSSTDQKTTSTTTESSDASTQVYDLETVEDLSDIVVPRTEAYQDLIEQIQNGSGVYDSEIFAEQSSLQEALEEVQAYDEADNLLVNSAKDYLSLMYENMTAFADAIKASGTTSQTLYQSALSDVSQVEETRSSFYTLLNAARSQLDLDTYDDLS